MAPVYLQDLLDLYRFCRRLRSGNMQLLNTQSCNLKWTGSGHFSICAPQLWNALPRELIVCDSVGSFKKALKTFLFKKAYCWVKLRQTFHERMFEIGPKISRFYLSSYFFFSRAIFNFLITWSACGLLTNKRYINKLLLLLLLLSLLLLLFNYLHEEISWIWLAENSALFSKLKTVQKTRKHNAKRRKYNANFLEKGKLWLANKQ